MSAILISQARPDEHCCDLDGADCAEGAVWRLSFCYTGEGDVQEKTVRLCEAHMRALEATLKLRGTP